MRNLLAAVGFCMFLAHTALSQVEVETTQYRLKGPVNSVRVEKSKISEKEGKSIEGPRVLSSEYVFDSRGRLVESLICTYDGSPYVKYQAIYNDRHKLEETYHKPKGDLIDKMVYSYGPDGRLIEKTSDKDRKSTKGKSVFTYDERGRIIERVRKNTKDPDDIKLVYSYDDVQSKIEYAYYDLKGTLTSTTIQRYDKQARLIEEEHYQNTESSRVSKWSFAYDAHGNIVEETLHILDGVSTWRYEYQADSYNNWTKRLTFAVVNRNGTLSMEPVQATYRTITYNAGSNESPVAAAADLASIVSTGETKSFLLGEAVRRQQPRYPDEARRQLQAGKIKVYAVVDESGNVISARAAPSKAELLRSAATFAAWDWKFNPPVSGGIAVRDVGWVTFTFHL